MQELLSTVYGGTMSNQSYTTSFSVDRAPDQVFDAVNDVRSWWMTRIDGDNHAVGDEFSYRVPGVHFCKMRVTELVAGERVVWQVVDNHMGFIEDQSEWKGTEIRFELSAKDGATEVRFTHDGLVPSYQCFDVCRNAWTFYVGDSLRSLAATGQGKPSDPDTLSLGDEARVG
jgi:uncharacterized protein YndB with AHSA1/START domain